MVLHPPLGTATVTFVSFALQTTFGHFICVFQLPVAEGELVRARTCLAEARERLSAYAPPQGHLTEVDAALGDVECAIVRLRPFASACNDPDYAAQLAQILENAGDIEEARGWRAWAASRYDALPDTPHRSIGRSRRRVLALARRRSGTSLAASQSQFLQ
jgi:hypothetical protein